ncbi:hypothetical protein RJ640_019792 [Escallonia rubra]|uniref:VTT domain-containing protein n=1 Tax=Escallonia rubra TaxID=112253 RepID=A0AA88UVC8_9ASTE|nr:hypothetical protein RJ640_019792 [Escallonia rubra]
MITIYCSSFLYLCIVQLGGGYVFGLPVGFAADSIGATLGATAAFLLGRTIGRSYVISKLKDYPKFKAVAIAIQRSGFKIVLLLRLVPLLPFNMLNYLLSVTPVHLGEYMLASWIGMMPITFGLVYVGTTLKDLSDVTHGWNEVSKTRWVRMLIITLIRMLSSLLHDIKFFGHWSMSTMIMMASGFVITVIIMAYIAKVAKASLEKALEENPNRDGLVDTPGLPIRAEPSLDLENALIIKIDPSGDNCIR